MHDYISLKITANPFNEDITDLLASYLAEVDFESFETNEGILRAYIKKDLYDSSEIEKILSEFPIDTKIQFEEEIIKGKDWNEEWEKNYFQPILIDGECVVHSSFHKEIPNVKYDILIDPKMAFGTGHHSTTRNMLSYILETDMRNKIVTDMGSGTGILAILCKMKGAGFVSAIEIDPFAKENADENFKLNSLDINSICGDENYLGNLPKSDFFLANINRNIIVANFDKYIANLKKGGHIIVSGFYEEDIPIIEKEAIKYGLSKVSQKIDNNWAAVCFLK